MPYTMLKAHIPMGPLFVQLFGGVAVNDNFALRALEGNMEKDLSTSGNQAVFEDGSLDFDKMWGFGYLAGAGLGVTIDQISIQVTCQFRNIRHELNISADYADNSEVSPGGRYDPGEEVTLLMRGFSVELGGSLSF